MIGRLLSRKSFTRHGLPSPARPRIRPRLEELESRTLLSASAADAAMPLSSATPQQGNGPAGGYTPSQIQTAYGFTQLPSGANGNGQTIAIVDAYNDPNIYNDVNTFDSNFGLPGSAAYGSSSSFLTVVNQSGTVINPAVKGSGVPLSNASWGGEISLDVEWAHAMAPGASIVLVEANSGNLTDMLAAVDTASSHSGVSVVSMSWGYNEFTSETSYDSHFSPTTHPGVTFVAASGDSGAGTIWPSVSPNVVAVGGTSLNLTSSSAISSESGWGTGRSSWFYGGSGGGASRYESQPNYQASVVDQNYITTQRTTPDVAYDANPNTGFSVYDSFGYGGWLEVGGTSAGAPQWSAIFAIANQERASAGMNPLTGGTQTLPTLYSVASSDFHDITTGNNGYSALSGYDVVTGRGTPIVNLIVNDLVNNAATAAAPALKTASTTTNTHTTAGHKDIVLAPNIDPTVGAGSNSSTTTANNPVQSAVTFSTGGTVVSGSTSATPFPMASAVFGQPGTIATASVSATSGTTGSLATFTTFTGLLSTQRANSAHDTGGYDDSAAVTTNEAVPQAPVIIEADVIEATPVPITPAGAELSNGEALLLQGVSGCDAVFADEEALLALGGDSEQTSVVEDDAAVVRSAGLALIGFGAVLSGFWIEYPGETEEVRRRAALLLLTGK